MNGPVASSNASQEARCAIAILNSVGWNLFASWPAAFKHLSGAVAFLKTPLTNGAIEAVNGLLQLAKRLASGFRSLRYFRIMAYSQNRWSSSQFAFSQAILVTHSK